MNNILKLSAIAILAFAANSQAAQLVQTDKANATELLNIAKIDLANTMKLNMIEISPIKVTAHAQVVSASNEAKTHKSVSEKTTLLAE